MKIIQSAKQLFPRLLFSLVFVYIILLGIINISISLNKDRIENQLEILLEAEKISIGHISNLPLVFVSGTDFTIRVNRDLTIKIEGFYLHYRFWKIFTQDYVQIVKDIEIDNIEFDGHVIAMQIYAEFLQRKFANKKIDQPIKTLSEDEIKNIIQNISTTLHIRNITLTFNAMTEFWNKITLRNTSVEINNNHAKWNSQIQISAVWSNLVQIADARVSLNGNLSNISETQTSNFAAALNFNVNRANIIGIPIVRSNLVVQTTYSNNKSSLYINDTYGVNNIQLETEENFYFSLSNTFDIAYEPYEEYELLDYVFKPAKWTFLASVSQTDDWNVNIQLFSPEYPSYGLTLNANDLISNKLYKILLNLKTHYFGTVDGDLLLPIRQGLFPLPEGSLNLDNVRFILNGLIFSGNATAQVVPNENALTLQASNVFMNGGHVGSTSVKFLFGTPNGFEIEPVPNPNSALDVQAIIGARISVELYLYDVDGDFVAQNIKIPIFGIKDSRYRGYVTMWKNSYLDVFRLEGSVQGFLDEEEQINAQLMIVNNIIEIPKLEIINPNIIVTGSVKIDSFLSNTVVMIMGDGTYNQNTKMPINIVIDVQKDEVKLAGLVNEQIQLDAFTKGTNTDFNVNFPQFSMTNLGFVGTLDGLLNMEFDSNGITRFALQNGTWKFDTNRTFAIEFDSQLNPETKNLDTSIMKLGLDNDILNGHGYFSFQNNFEGSFRFDRNSSFQFSMGRYVVRANIDLNQLEVDNILANELFAPVSFLRTQHTETVLVSINANVLGTWANLKYNGSIFIEGSDNDDFRFAIPNFIVADNTIAVTNLRLRHPLLNIDTDSLITMKDQYTEVISKGSIALENVAKSDFTFNYTNHEGTGVLAYNVPNLYLLSTKPVAFKGKILHDNQQYVFLSDKSGSGIVGSYTAKNDDLAWDLSILHDSMKVALEGEIVDRAINSAINWDILLNRLSLTGDIRSLKGTLNVNSTISGTIDAPIINGELISKDIELAVRSLRNRIQIQNEQKIIVSNNQILLPDIEINAIGGGKFGLDGHVYTRDSSIEDMNINFYSKNQDNDGSFLNWNLEVPYLSIKGRTYISNITLSGDNNNALLSANIDTENLNLGLELDDTLAPNTDTPNPILGLLSLVNLDLNVNMKNKSRFLNQLFDIEFEQQTPAQVQGNIGDGTLNIVGNYNVSKGRVTYLNTDLNVQRGGIEFSGEAGDVNPYITIESEINRSLQNEIIDINVDFEGKLPNLELARISSTPSKQRSELLNLLGLGGTADTGTAQNPNTGNATDVLASGVGVAENALFTAPLTRRIQRLIPFIDTFQIKTDVLGNLTRAANRGDGSTVTGLEILHGAELEVGQYIPRISGLQFKYNLRLESPGNSSVDSSTLNQLHKVGLEWSRVLPQAWQLGLGVNVLSEVRPAEQQDVQPDLKLEGSIRKSW